MICAEVNHGGTVISEPFVRVLFSQMRSFLKIKTSRNDSTAKLDISNSDMQFNVLRFDFYSLFECAFLQMFDFFIFNALANE